MTNQIYRWVNAHAWLEEAVKNGQVTKADLLEFLLEHVNADNIQDQFQTMMDEQGYFHEAHELWAKLGDVPVNDDGEIEEPFLHFTEGTDREDIWYWFEDFFNISVTELQPSWK